MIYEYAGYRPVIGESVFIAGSADVIGDVYIGDESSVWFGTVVRADEGPVRIGSRTNVQDNATIHDRVVIGNGVTIGHNAVVHACTVEDDVLIGMGAVILDNALIGAGSIIAAGAVIKSGTIVPPRTLFAGNPAVQKKDLPEETIRHNQAHAAHYAHLAAEYGAVQKK